METYLVPMWVVECGVQREGCISMVKEADAQATIAALEAEVKDLKEWLGAYKQSIELAQSEITQRTAELEAAKRDVQTFKDQCIAHMRDRDDYAEELREAHAELERVRALIAALPKVEGEILEQGDFAFVRYAHVDGPLPEIPRREQIALLQHRQGME